jgi:hypothetical protein
MLGLHDDQSVYAAIALAPIFFWELSVGLWMTFKGFNPAALAALGFDSSSSGVSTGGHPSEVEAPNGGADSGHPSG